MARIHKLTKNGQAICPATRMDAVVHPDLKVAASELIGEVNVSKIYPTGGTDGTDKYTLEAAVAKIPESLRSVGIKCSFLNDAGGLEAWTYTGGEFTNVESWVKNPIGQFIVSVKDIPYFQGVGYNTNGTVNTNLSTDSATCVMDVSCFSRVEFNENIYTSIEPVGCIAFFGSGMNFISGARNNKTNFAIPEGTKYLTFTFKVNKIETLQLTLKGYKGDGVPGIATVTRINGLWDGELCDLSFFGIEIANNAQAVNRVSLCGIINKIKYVNSEDLTERNLFQIGGAIRSIAGWMQSEEDKSREWYLRKEKHDDGGVSFFFDDEIRGTGTVYLSVEQISWNDGVKVKDKGGNVMRYTKGRNNSLPYVEVGPFAYELLLAPDHKDGWDGEIEAYIKEPVQNTYVEPVGANRVLLSMLAPGILGMDDGHYSNVGGDYKSLSALYIPVEPETTYVFLGGGPENFVSGSMKVAYPVICMDNNKKVIKAYTQEDVQYFGGSASFNYSGMFVFTTPTNAAYASLVVYNTSTNPVDPGKVPVIVTTLAELPVAVRGCGDSRVNKWSVTGKDFKAVMKQTMQECVWILGDSISNTGYGGGLTTIYGEGSGGWIKYFIDIIKPLYLYNGAKGGYTLTDASTTFTEDGVVQGASQSYLAEIENLISNYQTRVVDAPPNFLLIVGCTNDFGKTRSNPNGWSQRSFVMNEDLDNESLNPDKWDYDTFMERKFMTAADGKLIPVQNVPVFKIAGAVRYIVERAGTMFPNCKFMVCSSLPNPGSWLNQKMCHKEMRWIARRLAIPFVDINAEANTPMIWDIAKQGTEASPHRFINDGNHPYGAADSEGASFITAGAMYMGKFIANAFEQYFWRKTDKDILVVDYTSETGYPHEYNT